MNGRPVTSNKFGIESIDEVSFNGYQFQWMDDFYKVCIESWRDYPYLTITYNEYWKGREDKGNGNLGRITQED